MIRKLYVCIFVFVGLSMMFGLTLNGWADHHQSEEIKSVIRQFYNQMRSGEYEKAFSHFKIGGFGYLPYGGLLDEIPTEEVRKGIIQKYEKDHQKGYRLDIIPKHIQVTELDQGNTAIAVYYGDGQVTHTDRNTEFARSRISMVLVKEEGQWKIFHWHVSRIQAD